MEVKIATESDKNLWDEVINNSKDSTIFHTWKWLKIMEKYSQKKFITNIPQSHLYPLIVSEKNEVVGVIPLYLYRNFWGKWIHSPPLHVECLYLGPIFKNFETLKPRERYHNFFRFQTILHDFLTENLGVNSIKIRSSTGFEDPRGFQWSGYKIEPRFTYFLDLKRDKEEIYKNFQKRLRNYLRGNERVGIEIEEGSHENLEPILLLMKEKERIDAPLEFIHEAFNSFYPHNVRIFIAKHNDNFLSGLLVTIFKNKVSSWIGTPGVSFKGVYPNEFLFWHLIQWSMDQGMEYFEIMGADDLSLVPFKNKWNAEIRRSYLAKWMSPGFHRINSLYSLIRQKDLT